MQHPEVPKAPLVRPAENLREDVASRPLTLAQEWDERRRSNKPYTIDELRKRIEETDAKSPLAVGYGLSMERAHYVTAIERMRLRDDLAKKGFAQVSEKERTALRDLDLRMAYIRYEQEFLVQFMDSISRYEQHRTDFRLDRPESEGGIPRNAVLEQQVRKQHETVEQSMKILSLVRRIKYLQHAEPEGGHNATDVQVLFAELQKIVPGADITKLDALYVATDEAMRRALGETTPETKQKGRLTPLSDTMMAELLRAHFDSLTRRRMAVQGKSDAASEQAKKDIAKEQEQLLDRALQFQATSYNHTSAVISLLTLRGHVGAPLASGDKPATGKFGQLSRTETFDEERGRRIRGLRDYMEDMRNTVLNRGKEITIPVIGTLQFEPDVLFEDIMTTHLVPFKIQHANVPAEWAVLGWRAHDAMWSMVGVNWGTADARKKALLKPFYEKLGLPENFGELPAEEKKKLMALPHVQQKLQSVRKLLEDHKKQYAEVFGGIEQDLALLDTMIKMKPPSSLVFMREMQPMPRPFTLADLKTDEDWARAYIAVCDSLCEGHKKKLADTHQSFIGGLRTNMNMNLNIGDAEMKTGIDIFFENLKAGLLILLEGAGAYLALRYGIPYAIKKSPAMARGAFRGGRWVVGKGVQGGSKMVEGGSKLMKGLRGVPKAVPPTTSALPSTAPATGGSASTGVAVEKAAEGTSKLKVAGRVLGNLGFVLGESVVIYEIAQKVKETRKSEHIGDRERAHTALEFWKGKQIPGIPGGMSLETGREQFYKEELQVLEKSAFVEDMWFVASQMSLPLAPTVPGNNDAPLAALASRRLQLIFRQQELLRTLAAEKDWLRIELPYLEKIFVRSTDEEKPGYRVNISGDVPGIKFYGGPIDDAMRAGPGNRKRHRDLQTSQRAPQHYADQFRTNGGGGMDEMYWREQAIKLKQRKTTEQLQQEFTLLAKDMEQYIEDVAAAEERVRNVPGAVLSGDTRTLAASDVLGMDIDHPIDLSEQSHLMQIESGGTKVYMRLPDVNWQWAIASPGGKLEPKNVREVNTTAENAGKVSFQGSGRLAFWHKGEKTVRFVVDVR